jgi:S-formylglutathione hydrolase FrmB
MRSQGRAGWWLALAAGLLGLGSPIGAAAAPPAFEVTYAPAVARGPVTARLYVMLASGEGGRREPRFGPDWFRPQPFFAVEARDWQPGQPLVVGADAAGFPAPLAELPPGSYRAQAVLRLNPDTHRLGDGEGNAYGPVVSFEVKADAAPAAAVPLLVETVVPPREFRETERLKLVTLPSPILSAFHGRPIRHRAAVVLPKRVADGSDTGRLPTLYIIPGFGGDHFAARAIAGEGFGFDWYGRIADDFVKVVLDPDCGTGHSVFADSATNGPRGKALVEEFIPHLEKTFPLLADPRARLLTGHSSGGWSTLWLQVTYPEFFGGTWSTSPDPVDFHDFSAIDLYAEGANVFRDAMGDRRPIARRAGRAVLWLEDFSRMEDVIGDGGQLRSFEAVFSPRGADGKPRPLYDRKTGAVDPETARAWEAYDIRAILEKDWPTLGPKLAGKLHVITGAEDTFYLEGAVVRLKAALEKLGSDAAVEVVPGRDHGTVLDAALGRRLDGEMRRAVSALRPDLAPKEKAAAAAGAR